MKDYEISIQDEKGAPTIRFANNTDRFVEVVFTVNGVNIQTGKKYTGSERGYCYPSRYAKNIKVMASGVKIDEDSEIQGYVFRGSGKYKEIDFDLPPFIRRRIGGGIVPEKKKAIFRRLSDTPSAILSLN